MHQSEKRENNMQPAPQRNAAAQKRDPCSKPHGGSSLAGSPSRLRRLQSF